MYCCLQLADAGRRHNAKLPAQHYECKQSNYFAQQSGTDWGVPGGSISKADWFALAGVAAVDFTRDLYQPGRRVCNSVYLVLVYSNVDVPLQ